MQTSKKIRSGRTETSGVKSPYSAGKYRKEDNRIMFILLGALCVILPPFGVLLTWRAKKMTMTLRGIFSAAALASCTLIFFLLMRPSPAATDIRPTPATPQTVGYNAAPAVLATQVPAQPEFIVPAVPSATDAPVIQDSGELTDDTIVYAVTNNAASYHLFEICDQQENRRALTLRDALNEGLNPCEKCVGAMG